MTTPDFADTDLVVHAAVNPLARRVFLVRFGHSDRNQRE
jgi:hypothetical protein